MAKDFLLNSSGELQIVDGDLLIGESDTQHVDHVLRTMPGELKSSPLIGVGITNFLYSPQSLAEQQKLRRDIRLNLQADGASRIRVAVTDTIKIEAKYED